ncbi:transporter substrate-binding domain-containing protein [Lacimicrobium sp. SS2-24]|uniref:substrate-binding periplasmic protein n=1 Tax=Lacimicrobium sp. SS2-24 TaxID=2005569 RepID=UPI001FED9990|nr:transporter substrate-binding domain-containing protein [Lacimicrobium sp. SS2-24]
MMIFRFMLLAVLLMSSKVLAETYHFASIHSLTEQEVGRIVLPQLYNKLGISISISPLPAKRAEFSSIKGNMDGEIMRIYSYGEANPSMLRVPTPYYYLETMPFLRAGHDLRIENVADLSELSVARIWGVKHTLELTDGLKNAHDVDSTEKMMRLLMQGFVDVALTSKLNGLMTLQRHKWDSLEAYHKPLARQPLYHYVHNSHASLLPRIDQVIKDSKQSGELQRMIANAEKLVLESAEKKH